MYINCYLGQIGAILTFALLSITFCAEIHSLVVIGVVSGCLGFFVIPLTALFTTYSAEQTFPAPQASATGYLFAGSQTIGFVSGLLWISWLDEKSKWKVYLMFAAHTLIIIIGLFVQVKTK